MLAIRTIVHPTDFSEPSRAALALACSLARDYRAKLLVLHVGLRPELMTAQGVFPLDPEDYTRELRAKLDSIVFTDPSVALERHLVLGNDPSVEICEFAKEHHADLMVMGSHGRTGLSRVLMGSVAEQVLRHALCPVLTVRSRLDLPRDDLAVASAAVRPSTPV